jgi:hypothetical protein
MKPLVCFKTIQSVDMATMAKERNDVPFFFYEWLSTAWANEWLL